MGGKKAIEQEAIEGFWVCFYSYKEGSVCATLFMCNGMLKCVI